MSARGEGAAQREASFVERQSQQRARYLFEHRLG